jgi:predicted nucleotidyltransferase
MTLLLPSGPLHGVSLPLAKQAARFLLNLESAELYDFAVSLGVDEHTATPVWHAFIADGYIEQDAQGRYVPTERMHQLPQARAGKPLPRKKAEALLQQAIENAKAVNAEPPSAELYYVTRLSVFGSYLDESKQELGDLDIAWSIEERPGVEAFAMHCINYGKDSIAPTRGRVRPKSSVVRLTSTDTLLRLGCPFKVVYEFHSPVLDEVRANRARKAAEYQRMMHAQSTRMQAMLADPGEPKSGVARRKR